MNSVKPQPLLKKALFTVLLILFPVLFLIIFECSLRVVGYGDNFPLVIKTKKYGKEKYIVNRQVTKRYFNLPDSMIPEASEEILDAKKKRNGIRIICLGGSTTAGFPYELNATYPFQLQFRLRNALLDNYVEVINLGISAVNSYTVLDLMPEILKLHPDAIIIYMGHNEFYGAYGVASTQYISSNRHLVLFYLKLRKLRVVQFIGNFIHRLRGSYFSNQQIKSFSLMEIMARSQAILFGSEKVSKAAQNFDRNLKEIIQQARQENVLVVISTLVSNIEDQKPFISRFSNTLGPFAKQECEELLLRGRSYQAAGEHKKALETFSRLAKIDTQSANLYYYWGKSLVALGRFKQAYLMFSKARDLDMLRFRAPGFFNDIIKNVAEKKDIPVLDMEKVFQKASSDFIPGKDLFHEHLHPNFDGYRLMAQAFFETLKKIQFINPPQKIRWEKNLLTESNYFRILKEYLKVNGAITSLDLEFGNLRIFFLTNRWPFTGISTDLRFYEPLDSKMTFNLAFQHLQKKLSWDKAHYQLAKYYIENKKYNKAFKEYRAVNLTFYENYYPYLKIGDLYAIQERYDLAEGWYKKSLGYDPRNQNILIKLGYLSVQNKNFSEANKYFTQTIELDSSLSFLTNTQKVTLFYLLGVSNANLRNWQPAQNFIDKALTLQPDFRPAQKLRKELNDYQMQKD